MSPKRDWQPMKADRLIISPKVGRLEAGEIFKNPRMAKTLRRIADEGPEVFYRGDIAAKIVRCSEKHGGLFTARRFRRSSFGLGGADHSQLPRLRYL